MSKKVIIGGCSFTLGNELSDDVDGKTPSKKTWAYRLTEATHDDYICTASGGAGNSAIARRTFKAVSQNSDVDCVLVMWSFLSRYYTLPGWFCSKLPFLWLFAEVFGIHAFVHHAFNFYIAAQWNPTNSPFRFPNLLLQQ